jgi:hypothetical protein
LSAFANPDQVGRPGRDRNGSSRPRREFIYPHRAVRLIGRRRMSVAVAVSTAALLTLAVALTAQRLMDWHGWLAHAVIETSGVPSASWEPAPVWEPLGKAPAPDTPIPTFHELPAAPRLLLILAVVALLIVSRRWPLSRSLIGFVIVLLIASALLNSLYPDFRLTAPAFTSVWFKLETVVWLMLPWVSGLLFIVFQPRIAVGVLLVVVAQVYGFLFGVLRYSFFLGVMHHSGLLFFPVLWLALGLLAHLVYLLLFYSLSIHWASARLWGLRESWH